MRDERPIQHSQYPTTLHKHLTTTAHHKHPPSSAPTAASNSNSNNSNSGSSLRRRRLVVLRLVSVVVLAGPSGPTRLVQRIRACPLTAAPTATQARMIGTYIYTHTTNTLNTTQPQHDRRGQQDRRTHKTTYPG